MLVDALNSCSSRRADLNRCSEVAVAALELVAVVVNDRDSAIEFGMRGGHVCLLELIDAVCCGGDSLAITAVSEVWYGVACRPTCTFDGNPFCVVVRNVWRTGVGCR